MITPSRSDLGHPAEDLHRDVVGLVPLLGVRRDLGPRELADQPLDLALGVGQLGDAHAAPTVMVGRPSINGRRRRRRRRLGDPRRAGDRLGHRVGGRLGDVGRAGLGDRRRRRLGDHRGPGDRLGDRLGAHGPALPSGPGFPPAGREAPGRSARRTRDRGPPGRGRGRATTRTRASAPTRSSRRPSRAPTPRGGRPGDLSGRSETARPLGYHPVRGHHRGPLTNAVQIVAALLLVLLNGFFVAAEFSLARARTTRLDQLADAGARQRRARARAGAAHRPLPGGLPARHHARQPGARLAGRAGVRRAAASRCSSRSGSATATAAGDGRDHRLRHHHGAARRLRRARAEVGRDPAGRADGPRHGPAARAVPQDLRALHPRCSTAPATPSCAPSASSRRPRRELASTPEDLQILIAQSEEGGALEPEEADMLEGVFGLGRVPDARHHDPAPRGDHAGGRPAGARRPHRGAAHPAQPLPRPERRRRARHRAPEPARPRPAGGARTPPCGSSPARPSSCPRPSRSTSCCASSRPAGPRWPSCSTSTATSPGSSRWRT